MDCPDCTRVRDGCSHSAPHRPWLIRKWQCLEWQFIVWYGSNQLCADISRGYIALHETRLRLSVPFIIAEYEDAVLPDGSAERTAELVKREARFLGDSLKSRV